MNEILTNYTQNNAVIYIKRAKPVKMLFKEMIILMIIVERVHKPMTENTQMLINVLDQKVDMVVVRLNIFNKISAEPTARQ